MGNEIGSGILGARGNDSNGKKIYAGKIDRGCN